MKPLKKKKKKKLYQLDLLWRKKIQCNPNESNAISLQLSHEGYKGHASDLEKKVSF
jgi:hypothetical protein